MANKIYRCTLSVRGYELDSFGHVNHAVYVSYLEHARWKLLEEEGILLSHFQEWKRWPVIAKIEVQYIKPAFMNEVLEVRSQIVEHGKTHFSLEQNIYKGDAHILKARIQSVIVNERGRPTEIPAELIKMWNNYHPSESGPK